MLSLHLLNQSMAVKIRFARFGCRNRPFFRIIVADSKTPRDGKPIQVVGFYDPLSGKEDGNKYMGLKYDAVKYWLSVGAQPSDPVRRILFKAGLLTPPPMVVVKDKDGSKDWSSRDPIPDSDTSITL